MDDSILTCDSQFKTLDDWLDFMDTVKPVSKQRPKPVVDRVMDGHGKMVSANDKNLDDVALANLQALKDKRK